jgi:hypothetical protein
MVAIRAPAKERTIFFEAKSEAITARDRCPVSSIDDCICGCSTVVTSAKGVALGTATPADNGTGCRDTASMIDAYAELSKVLFDVLGSFYSIFISSTPALRLTTILRDTTAEADATADVAP